MSRDKMTANIPKFFSLKTFKKYANKFFNVQKITQTFMLSMHIFEPIFTEKKALCHFWTFFLSIFENHEHFCPFFSRIST